MTRKQAEALGWNIHEYKLYAHAFKYYDVSQINITMPKLKECLEIISRIEGSLCNNDIKRKIKLEKE